MRYFRRTTAKTRREQLGTWPSQICPSRNRLFSRERSTAIVKSRNEDEGRSDEAVSYTHLDVYKRQARK